MKQSDERPPTSTVSAEFRTLWAAHDVRSRNKGLKRLQHPVVGYLELTYQSAKLANPARAARSLNIYTAEPGTTHEHILHLLASWSATPLPDAEQQRRP